MQFNKNGKFKIMQITDMQEIPSISPDTLALLNAAVESEKPDLVVYTGDQIKGYGITYKGKNKEELENSVRTVISRLLEPVTSRNIPFAVTFGNHDPQVGISLKDQINDIYAKLPGFVGANAGDSPGPGTYNIPLKSSDGSGRDAANLYLFYSGTDAKGGGYESFNPEYIKWYQKKRDELKEKNGHYVPSLVFQHIPLPEYYEALKRVKKFSKGAIRAFRTHKNEYYTLPDDHREGDMLNEPPSIPNSNTGEYAVLSEKGDVFAVYVGHDHKNSFTIRHENMDFGFTQSSGFNCYGAMEKRGVRVFVLDENNPSDYKTYTRTYIDLLGHKPSKPFTDFLMFHAPETVDAAIPMVLKALLAIAAIVAIIILLVKLGTGGLLWSLLTVVIYIILYLIL